MTTMLSVIVVLKVLCLAPCLSSSMPYFHEGDTSPASRIPHPDRVLNSVLSRLERSRQDRTDTDARDNGLGYKGLPEYTESFESVVERGLRQLVVQKHYSICHMVRKIRRLNTEEYEYRPAYYEEVKCAPAVSDEEHAPSEICSSLGFSCVQWNKTIHLTRRRYDSDCWETKTMIIPSGCECMWPVQQLGDIKYHD